MRVDRDMLKGTKSSGSEGRRIIVATISLALLCAVIAFGFAKQISQRFPGGADAPIRSEDEARKGERADASDADKMSVLPAQTSAQFDLSRNVIGGGGGRSSGGN